MSDGVSSMDDLLAHASWARRLARSLVRDEAQAADLVQEAWVIALRQRPDAGRPVRPWLAQVLRNLQRAQLRARARRERRELDAFGGGPAEPAPIASSEQLVDQLEQQRLLGDLVLALPEPLRATLLLRYYEDLNASEIAARQKIPAGTVRWRLKEGIDRLRVQLDERAASDRNAWRRALSPLSSVPVAKLAVPIAVTWKGLLMVKILLGAAVVVGAILALVIHRSPVVATVATTAPAGPRATTNGAATPPVALPKLNAGARARLVSKLTTARTQRAASPPASPAPATLDPSYVREQMEQLIPMVQACFEQALVLRPNIAGKLLVRFTISGEQGVGGLVSQSEIVDEASTIPDEELRECVAQTMYAAQFAAPANGGEIVVEYPFVLLPPDDDSTSP